MIFEILAVAAVAAVVAGVFMLFPKKVSAHCDTMDGPAVKDGKKALETGNINYAYKWILAEHEAELKEVFEKALKVRKQGSDAEEVADRWFLENFVRIHRAGEGAGYDGLKPSGTILEPVVVAADKSIEIGDMSPLKGLVTEEEYHALEEKFEKAIALKDFDINDVDASRAYVHAYVTFFKMAEGEEHDHGDAHGHEPGHSHEEIHGHEHDHNHADAHGHHGH